MNGVLELPRSSLSCVTQVSVQVSEYSEENGGSDRKTGKLYAVETLFRDGTWVNEGYYRMLAIASIKARDIAEARGALLLPESIWPNRKIGKAD